MEDFADLLDELGIGYIYPKEEYVCTLPIYYNGEEIECECFHSPDNDLIIDSCIKGVAFPEAKSFIASNSLRKDYFSCAIYPILGILNHLFIIPSKLENKKEYLLNELNYIINLKEHYEIKYNEIHGEDETLYEHNIIEDAIKLTRSLDLDNFKHFIFYGKNTIGSIGANTRR